MPEITPPRLTVHDEEFACGYGPRAIRLSLDRKHFFVGCKDGSVTQIDLDTAGRSRRRDRPLCDPGKTGIRSICDLGNGWLLLGQDEGGVCLLGWREEWRGEVIPRADLEEDCAGGVGYVGRWDDAVFVVSPRRRQAFLLRLEEPGPQAHPPFALVASGTLPGVVAMSGFMRVGDVERWIVGKTGGLWQWQPTGLEPMERLWREWGLERPGFVFDNAVVRAHPDAGHDLGIYLSTDEGVFLLRPRSAQRDRGPHAPESGCRIDPVFLPGIPSTCLAITHAVRDGMCFLWVSDTEGSVHLFWSDLQFWIHPEWQDRIPLWHRSGLLERRFPVMRAVASWSPSATDTAVVGQACRDDRVVVSWYRSHDSGVATSAMGLADVLSWGEIDRLRPGEARRGWCIEALVADHVEDVGTDPEQLRRFLRDPGTDLACSALREILDGGSPPRHAAEASAAAPAPAGAADAGPDTGAAAAAEPTPAERAARAITLWTHTLLGTVHRRLATGTAQHYLGIIRWLRRLGETELLRSDRSGMERLRETIEGSIQFARKWGLFGGTYAARQPAFSALTALSRQEARDRRFDRLVYESLIFRRRTDLAEILPAPPPPSHDLPPWELKYLALPAKEAAAEAVEYLAVSWAQGCTIYRRQGGKKRWRSLALPGGRAPRAGERTPGRRTLLGVCGPKGHARPFILSSPAPSENCPEEIELRFLEENGYGERAGVLEVSRLVATGADPVARRSAGRESVYSLLGLGSRWVVAGLRGTLGGARFGLLEVRSDGDLVPLPARKEVSFPSIYPEAKSLPRNEVWALAALGASAEQVTLFLGCNDGQVWKVHITFHEDDFESSKPVAVARLGAPVTAIACRAIECASAPLLRIFTGLADGTLVAFQALGDWTQDEESYATLWATQERSRIRDLHCFDGFLDAPAEQRPEDGSQQLVLAVTQQGTAILVLDRPAVEPRAPGDEELRRLKVPGQQLGRFWLGSAVFGSVLLPVPRDAGVELEMALARLLVAPAAGGPRELTLHHPKFTPVRQGRYSELRGEWMRHLRGNGRIEGHLLRRAETTYAASPALPTGLVRWILPFDPRQETWEVRCQRDGPGDQLGPVEQWLPKHLRPLVHLEVEWNRPGDSRLRGLLRAALLAAREVGDRALFKEIIEATLSRANHQLYLEAMGGSEPAFAAKFRDLLADLEEVRGAWEGTAEEQDTRIRITVAKSLLDGDTLWSLSRVRILAEIEGRYQAASKQPLAEAMQERIEVIYRFLGKGDQLLALETLRAANRALLRLCGRLVRDSPADWSEIREDNHLHWETIKTFYQAVGDFAARVAHSKGTLGEVAAHEICRTYALGMLACPSEMVRLAIWIMEADLPIDVERRVNQQLELLAHLLGEGQARMPEKYRDLLQVALRTPQAGDYEKSLFFARSHSFGWALEKRQAGAGNAEMVAARRPFDDIIVWLHDLARQLADDAGDVDLERFKDLAGGIDTAEDETRDQLRHSRAFWREAFKDLCKECKKFPHLFPATGAEQGDDIGPRPVRPELVLFSSSLEEWCRRQRGRIRDLRAEHQLFEPLSSLYDEALALVERTASRFRQGAAVQKSLVLGVLSHGLLEMLDEHLLEVWEVAQALDPRHAWEEEKVHVLGTRHASKQAADQQPPATSTAGRFADYLLQRALKAEVVPKNLRSLQDLLGFSTQEEGGRDEPPLTLPKLLAEFESEWNWHLDSPPDVELDQPTYHFLYLTLTELAQNDRVHGELGDQGGQENGWRPPRVAAWQPPAIALRLEFHYSPQDDQAFQRAKFLISPALQGMIAPRDNPRVPSHGTGLYLANLAASAVGWKLELEPPRERGELCFTLAKHEGDGR